MGYLTTSWSFRSPSPEPLSWEIWQKLKYPHYEYRWNWQSLVLHITPPFPGLSQERCNTLCIQVGGGGGGDYRGNIACTLLLVCGRKWTVNQYDLHPLITRCAFAIIRYCLRYKIFDKLYTSYSVSMYTSWPFNIT